MSVVALPVEPCSIISSKQRSAFCFFVSMASRVFGGVVNSFKESSKILRHSAIILSSPLPNFVNHLFGSLVLEPGRFYVWEPKDWGFVEKKPSIMFLLGFAHKATENVKRFLYSFSSSSSFSFSFSFSFFSY